MVRADLVNALKLIVSRCCTLSTMGVRRGDDTAICPPWKLGLGTKIF